MIISHENPKHAPFPSAVLPPPSEVQIISSAASSVAPTLYVSQCERPNSHSYKIRKITALHILHLMCLYSRREDKRLWSQWQHVFPEFNLLLISRQHGCHLFASFPKKSVNTPTGRQSPLSHLTSCTPTKSNLHFVCPFASVFNERGLQRLRKLQFPNLITTFSFLSCSKPSTRIYETFRKMPFSYNQLLLALRLISKLEDHPLSAVRDCLFSIVTATLRIWRSSLPSTKYQLISN